MTCPTPSRWPFSLETRPRETCGKYNAFILNRTLVALPQTRARFSLFPPILGRNAMIFTRSAWFLGLAAGALLQAGTGCFIIDNQTDTAWILGGPEGKAAGGSWSLEARDPGAGSAEGKGQVEVIAAGASVTVRLAFPEGAAPPELHLRDAAADERLALGLEGLDWRAAAGAQCTFVLHPGQRLERRQGPPRGRCQPITSVVMPWQ